MASSQLWGSRPQPIQLKRIQQRRHRKMRHTIQSDGNPGHEQVFELSPKAHNPAFTNMQGQALQDACLPHFWELLLGSNLFELCKSLAKTSKIP